MARPPSALAASDDAGLSGVFVETFEGAALDSARWLVTSAADGKGGASLDAGRLRLWIESMGTLARTVKYFGLRSASSWALTHGLSVAADLDWSQLANASYFSAALVLAPAATATNPLETDDWVMVQYIGVPPRANGRIEVSARRAGVVKTLFDEGWPDKNRTGRTLGAQRVELRFIDGGLELRENGNTLWRSSPDVLPFPRAHVYLQVATHSNYPVREIFFDNVAIGPTEP